MSTRNASAPVTTAYLDPADETLCVVSASGRTLRTFMVPPQVLASHAGRQGAWARNILRAHGFTPEHTATPYPYGIAIPLA